MFMCFSANVLDGWQARHRKSTVSQHTHIQKETTREQRRKRKDTQKTMHGREEKKRRRGEACILGKKT